MKHIIKQVLAFILIAAMTTVLFTVGAAAAEDTPADEQSIGALLGDVDGDGEVMIVDAAFIQRWLSGMPIPFVLNDKIADTDEDNDITIFDVNYIQRWLVNLPSNPKIGTQLEEAEEYNTIIDPECYNTVLKISDKVDSKLCSTAYQGVDDVLLGINPDAAYYFKLADTSVVDLAANRTRIYAVSEGNTTAEVFQELDDKTTKIGTINVSVVKAKMSEVADNAFLFYSGGELNGQVLKTNFGKPEFDMKTAIKKVLVNNEELGTKFSENDYEVTYQSSDEKVAVVSNSGIVSGTGNGSCQIDYSIRFSDDSVYNGVPITQVTGKAIEKVEGYSIDNIRDYVVGLNTPVELADGTKTPMINFDNAATTPALMAVRDAINEELEMYGSIGRGFSQKSNHSTDVYNSVRDKVLDFFTADPELYTCFYVNSTTDGLNKLASALVESKDDIVLTTRIEHHANDLSWRERCKVIYAEVDEKGRVIYDDIEKLLKENDVKIVSISAASNVTGYVNDVHRVAKLAHKYGAEIVVDGAQIVAHRKFEMMGDLNDPNDDIDYFAFSAHKMYSPYGGGAVVGLTETLNKHMPQFYGGGTITVVGDYWQNYKTAPAAYEAGSPNYPGVVGLGKAIDVLSTIGMDKIEAHEKVLNRKLIDGLKTLPNVIIYGDSENISDRVGVITFNFSDINTYFISQKLSELGGVATRRGAFCAHPYVWRLMGISDEKAKSFANCSDINTAGMVRVSFGIYNNEAEVDRFLELMPSVMEAAKAAQSPLVVVEY
ncbi:aminotransferase class V-fold PLP-dependent enzyme [uncultured Ruminococcus sp.]|uniref:aminotransferase class V-fold PLP-dependent enzyme n=1 Tax=uncultured Ruminococcus sp. TaxID=165186 RepID=UPI00292E6C3B|nr:aminotransferase class V-fold PLP-dependent enzyme [uncultured Ruminococcus sp.]